MKKHSLLPFQNSSPIILQNIFKYLNLEDFSKIQLAYQKSKSLILQKQFLKISKTFSKKTLHHEKVFEFTTGINSENLSPTKETKFLNSLLKSKLIKFSNFINHVMIYHEFRFISYIDGSFSIETKIENTKHYVPISCTIQTLTSRHKQAQCFTKNQDFLKFLRNASKQFLNISLEKDPRLFMLFENEQISFLDYSISINSNNTYFVSFDKTYVVRFFDSNFFAYHIPTGRGYKFNWLSWKLLINPRAFDFKPVTKIGEFLPSCHPHPKVKQMIFEKIKNSEISEQKYGFFLKFQLNCTRGPNSPVDYSLYFADHVYMDLYV